MSKPLPRTRRKDYTGNVRFAGLPDKENRARQLRRGNDTEKNVSITLKDIDSAIQYYFNNVLTPTVIDNGQIIKVPIMYGNPERWKSIQRDGFIRDEKGKIIAPLIMWRRTNVSKNTDIPVDKTERNITYQFEKQFTEQNKYDNFSILTNKIPTRERYNVVIPDYVLISYECVVWTSYVEQMNKILELFQYSEGAYWGDANRFKFYTSIDNFDQIIESATDAERSVKMNFTLNLKGYLIPESYNNLVNTQKQYTTQQIIIKEVGTVSLLDSDTMKASIISSMPSTQQANVSFTVSNEKIVSYLSSTKFKKNTSIISDDGIGQSIAVFDNVVTSSAPSGLSQTTKDDFIFFVNGQYIEHDAITLQQSGITFNLIIATGSLGYALDIDDEVIGWGKFV